MEKRPVGLLCHVCSREFGSKSLAIHLPTCESRFEQIQVDLPKSLRKPPPPRPRLSIPEDLRNAELVSEYNAEAWDIAQNSGLFECPGCHRRFSPDRLVSHLSSCKAIDSDGVLSKSGSKSDPLSLTCHLCGRGFGTRSLSIHIGKCEEKFQAKQQVLPKRFRMSTPSPPTIPIPSDQKDRASIEEYNAAAWEISQRCLNPCPYCKRSFNPDTLVNHLQSCTKKTSDEDPWAPDPSAVRRPRSIICYICGQQLLNMRSLEFHQKKCLVKWENEQKQLPPELRRPLPKNPFEGKSHEEIESMDVYSEKYNEAAYSSYTENLVPCEKCGRTFLPDRLLVHLRSCKGEDSRLKIRKAENSDRPSSRSAGSMSDDAVTSISSQSSPLNSSSSSYVEMYEDLVDGHLGIKKDRPSTPDLSHLDLVSSEKSPEERVQCSICGRKFAVSVLQRHERVCKGQVRPSTASDAANRFRSRQTYDPRASLQSKAVNDLSGSPSNSFSDRTESSSSSASESNTVDGLVPCRFCQRTFLPDRVSKHESVCQAASIKKNSGARPSTSTVSPKDGTVSLKNADRLALSTATPSSAPKRVSLKERMAASHQQQVDARIPCRYCSRKFAPDRIETHESICMNLARPKTAQSLSSTGGRSPSKATSEKLGASLPSPSLQTTTQRQTCASCSSALPKLARYCPMCGASLGEHS